MKDISQLSSDFASISVDIENKLKKAQRDTAKQIQADVKGLAPVDTGAYRDSIKVSNTKVDGTVLTTNIYTNVNVKSLSTGNKYNLGFLLETGTLPHKIKPVKAKVLHFEINGEDIFATEVNHPGFASIPHFKPALNKNKITYINNIKKVLDKEFK